MALNNVFRELPVINSSNPIHLANMIRTWIENFQRIALNSGTTADTALSGTTGHVHNGVDGQGPPVSAVSNTVVTAGGSTVWHAANDSPLVKTTAARTISVQHTFSITSGGAPFVCSTNNTSLVTNLNADQLDSLDSTQLVQSTASNSVRHASTEVSIGAIAASSIQTFTISISGSVGSTVFLGAPSAIEAGLTWCAFVSSANVVTVRVYNSTAGGITPASATWNVTMMRRA